MVSYLFASIIVAVLGLAAVTIFLAAAVPWARERRELARRKHEIASQDELEAFIRRVDQVTAADELDHLDPGANCRDGVEETGE
jgi:hypothetical protein